MIIQKSSWYWGIGFGMGIDFAVWVLEQSGLSAPPFDQHNTSDPSLADAGLTVDGWRGWLLRLVNEDRAYRTNPLPHQTWKKFVSQPASYYPAASESLEAALARAWEQYTPRSNTRRVFERRLVALLRQEAKPGSLYHEMNRARGDLPAFYVTLVGYPAAITYAIPPATLLLAPPDALYNFAQLRAILLQALADLQI